MEPMTTCVLCGESFSESRGIYVDNDCLCPSCAEERTTICTQCGERIYNDDNAGTTRRLSVRAATTAAIPAVTAAAE